MCICVLGVFFGIRVGVTVGLVGCPGCSPIPLVLGKDSDF